MYSFAYHKPTSLAEAAQLLAGDPDAKLMAGGQTYIPTLKQRLAQPTSVIDLNGVAELKGIKEEAGGVTIGAMSTHGEVMDSEVVKRLIPGLAELAEMIGDPQVRNLGTLGGSISNNDPAADYPAACVGLGATIRTNKREIPAEQFFTGMFETALQPDEIVTAVHFPRPQSSSYEKFRNPASRYAIVGVFVARTGSGVRVAVTGAAPSVFRWSDAEQALGSNFAASALDNVTVSPDGLNTDIHAGADYRAHLVKVMAKRAVEKLA
jgi:aerobic carbon-monoxide dehydrogenase medium subunit